MAADLYALMVKLGLSHNVSIVGHDIGTMVAYSYAAAHPHDVAKLVLSEAPIPDPSIYTYPALTANGPGLWWFGLFNDPGTLAYDLMRGKEKVWVTESIPVLEVAKNSITQCDLTLFTHYLATRVRNYATNVTGVVIPDTGHWLYEERPAEMPSLLLQFLKPRFPTTRPGTGPGPDVAGQPPGPGPVRGARREPGFVPFRSVPTARGGRGRDRPGDIDVDDPRTMTVQWYQHLLDSGANSPVRLAG